MKKTIITKSFEDRSVGDKVFQKEIFLEEEGTFCDCCETYIPDTENVGDEEDFCFKCYESGGISRYLKNTLDFNEDEHFHTMNFIREKYEKLKLKQK